MPKFQARLKPEHRLLYRGINPLSWYDVVPLFPGVTQRMTTMEGERLARLKVGKDFQTVLAKHFEIRPTSPSRSQESDGAREAEDSSVPAT